MKKSIFGFFGNLADLSVYVTGTAGGSERHRQ